MSARTLLLGWASILVCLSACQRADEDASVAPAPSADSATVTVYAVNYPLAWMAERIGADRVQVSLPVPAGTDPAHWQPTPEIVLAYQQADLVLLNGAGYANWIDFASLSPGRLVDTTRGLEDRFVPAGEVTHSHGPAGEHDHADVASHTWLDPEIATGQARAIAAALGRLVPAHESAFRQRLVSVETDLAQLDTQLTAALERWHGAGVLYSHPVYQYLDARYALAGRSVSWEPGEDPGEKEWNRLARRLADQPATLMLWEDGPLPATVDRLRQMGIEPVVFETGAARPAVGDYLTLMNENRERVAGARPANEDKPN